MLGLRLKGERTKVVKKKIYISIKMFETDQETPKNTENTIKYKLKS